MSTQSADFYTLIKEAEAAMEALCHHTDNLDGAKAVMAIAHKVVNDMHRDS